MQMAKIKIFIHGEYKEVDYDMFINNFVKNNFHYHDDVLQNAFIFMTMKISTEDKERIKQSFKNAKIKEEIWLKENSSNFNKEYHDRLYSFLYNLKFYNCMAESKPKILKMLNVPQFFIQQVLKDFTINK